MLAQPTTMTRLKTGEAEIVKVRDALFSDAGTDKDVRMRHAAFACHLACTPPPLHRCRACCDNR